MTRVVDAFSHRYARWNASNEVANTLMSPLGECRFPSDQGGRHEKHERLHESAGDGGDEKGREQYSLDLQAVVIGPHESLIGIQVSVRRGQSQREIEGYAKKCRDQRGGGQQKDRKCTRGWQTVIRQLRIGVQILSAHKPVK